MKMRLSVVLLRSAAVAVFDRFSNFRYGGGLAVVVVIEGAEKHHITTLQSNRVTPKFPSSAHPEHLCLQGTLKKVERVSSCRFPAVFCIDKYPSPKKYVHIPLYPPLGFSESMQFRDGCQQSNDDAVFCIKGRCCFLLLDIPRYLYGQS